MKQSNICKYGLSDPYRGMEKAENSGLMGWAVGNLKATILMYI